MHVVALCATKSRVRHLRKLIRCFLEQDYEGKSTLFIFNNSDIPQKLCNIELPDNKEIILVNNHIKIGTSENYTNLGQIYNDIFSLMPDGDIVTIMDDDDMYLPNHFSEAVKFLSDNQYIGYKPYKSYFKTSDKIELVSNTLEPSIFVKADYIKSKGCFDKTPHTHFKWIQPLLDTNKMLISEEGKPTLIYDWSGTIPVYKISGNEESPTNFRDHGLNSKDNGNGILCPITKEELLIYEPQYNSLYRK